LKVGDRFQSPPNAKFVLEADNIAPRGHNGLGEATQRSVVGDIRMARDVRRELLAVVWGVTFMDCTGERPDQVYRLVLLC